MTAPASRMTLAAAALAAFALLGGCKQAAAQTQPKLLVWINGDKAYNGLQKVGDAFERLFSEGATSGRMLSLNIHPWLLGQANRIRYLDEALAAIRREPGVWAATGAEIVDAYTAQQQGWTSVHGLRRSKDS